ncbi:MAG TPA: Clp protease N-terminal domain-containing protein [Hyphomicrobiales bacterium]|nr:Clp protease N-terminal domain-containing protein [Hyphomicrobiales bacterium]
MAETSGFQTDLPQSAYLSLSIERAISLAQQRSHRYVTLEHLLFTLMDDPSAKEILEGLRGDMAGIRGNIAEAVNRGLTSLYTPGEFDLHASYKVERVLQTASDDADRLNCEEVDAAFVIAALSRETDNMASEILRRNGIAYSSAVSWLYANRGATTPSPRKATTQPSNTESAELGVPPIDMPAPSTTPRGPALGGHVRAPANAAPARERYATVPSHTNVQAGHPAAAEKPAPIPSPQPDQNDYAGGDILELDVEAGEAQILAEQPFEEDEPEPVIEFRGPQGKNAEFRRRPPNGAQTQGLGERPAPPPRLGPSAPPAKAPANGSFSGYRGGERQQYPSPPMPSTEDGVSDPVPPVSRLEEMRLNRARARGEPQLPVPSKTASQKARRSRGGQPASAKGRTTAGTQSLPAKRPNRPRSPHEVFLGRLIENVPRKMRAAVAERIEVRISREETQALLRGFEGRGETKGHNISITQTMSVALRAPDGGFTIEPLSPETQWIFNRPDESDVYGRWRWVVTPSRTGTRKLQLLIASRSLSANGVVADSALPDQVITIRVRTNYWLTLARGIQWIAAMAVGGILTELAMFGMRFVGL